MTDANDADPDGEAAPNPDDVSETASEEAPEAADAAALDAYDLDDDGRISLTEDVRGELGMVDARAEELAEQPGLKGRIARAAHRLLDKLDND
jgi:hypothetical protein